MQADSSRFNLLAVLQLGAHTYAVAREQGLIAVAPDYGDDAEAGHAPRESATSIGEWWAIQRPKADRLLLVWQPQSLLSDPVDTKRVDRATFSKLENVTNSHPLINTGTCGWGFEPLPKGQMQGRTFLHIESEPGLQAFGEAIEAQGSSVGAAYSLASLVLQSHNKTIGKTLVLARDFVLIVKTPVTGGGAAVGRSTITALFWGERATSPIGPQQLQHQLEAAGFLSDPPSAWRVVATEEHASLVGDYLVAGDEASRKIWHERTSPVTLTGWETFITAARKSPSLAASADLWDTFPRPRPLGGILIGAGLVSALVAVFFGWQAFSLGKATESRSAAQAAMVEQTQAAVNELAVVAARIRESEARIAQMGASTIPRGRAEMLRLLGDILPEDFTMTSLDLAEDGRISLGFYQVTDAAADLVGATNRFESAGFTQTRIDADTEKREGLSVAGPIPPKRYRLTALYGQATPKTTEHQ